MKNSSKAVEPMKAIGKKKAGRDKTRRRKGAEGARETIGIATHPRGPIWLTRQWLR